MQRPGRQSQSKKSNTVTLAEGQVMVPQLGSSINKCSLLRECLLWVKSRHVQWTRRCPLYPQGTCAVGGEGSKNTTIAVLEMQ